MDTKNVIAAISLSAAVIILYSLFFAPPPLPRCAADEHQKFWLPTLEIRVMVNTLNALVRTPFKLLETVPEGGRRARRVTHDDE